MDEQYFRKIATTVIIGVLVVLSFFLLRPLLLPIIVGFILAFIFSPVYNWVYKISKLKNISAFVICILLLAAIIIPLWFFMPTLIDESIKIYKASLTLDLVTPLKTIFPSLFASQQFSQEVGSITQSFITNATNSLMNSLADVLLHFPTLLLQTLVVFFVFFYALKDKKQILNYIKSLLPFSKEIENKLFNSTKDITSSVLYGQIVIGIIQGIIVGAGLFLFGIPNAFLLSLLAIIAGILPILGPAIISIPVIISLVMTGNTFSAIGIAVFWMIATSSEHLLRPILIAKKTKLHTGVSLIGMIGGFMLFGIIGFILGPLILAYLIIIIEIYRNKPLPKILIRKSKKEIWS